MTNGRVEELFIENLHPGVEYNFTVLAFNEEGSSNRSDPFNITTREEGIYVYYEIYTYLLLFIHLL